MSNCGYCSIIVKERDSINELMEILNKNYDEERNSYFVSFCSEEYNFYGGNSEIQIETISHCVTFPIRFKD